MGASGPQHQSCYKHAMFRLSLLCFWVLISLSGNAWASAINGRQIQVKGVLALHWEYAYFATTISGLDHVFEIEIQDQRWLKKNRSLMMADPTSMGTYICIQGRGYVNPNKVGSTGRKTFILTKIISSAAVKSERDCHRRYG